MQILKLKRRNTMRRFVPAVFLALSLLAVSAKAQDETQGSQSVITSVAPRGCGVASVPFYCINVPTSIGGTCWFDIYYQGNDGGKYGFIACNGVADLGRMTIDSAQYAMGPYGPTEIDITFHGTTNDGDNDTFTGSGKLFITYYRFSRGYTQTLDHYTLTITY
jgi:hypothetical protein